MRLYLSSFQLGNPANRLRALVTGGHHAAIIMNALDNDPNGRSSFYDQQNDALCKLGFQVCQCDLRQYFGRPLALREALAPIDLVWVNGGNSFILSRAFSCSGFAAIIKDRLRTNSIVYGGFSAGAVIASPTLRGIDFLDAPTDVPAGYPTQVQWAGLHLIDTYVAVHYDPNPTSPIHQTIGYWRQHDMPHVKLTDGEVLIVDGHKTEIAK